MVRPHPQATLFPYTTLFRSSVEKDNKGFDLVARKPHPEDPKTAIDVRFVEVKGRAGVGEVALTANEDRKSTRLNSSHTVSSYAVFCLKKKITIQYHP